MRTTSPAAVAQPVLVCQNLALLPQFFCGGNPLQDAVKLRHIFALLLLLHLLVHPVLHAFPASPAEEVQAQRGDGDGTIPPRQEDFSCVGCRTAGPAPAAAPCPGVSPDSSGEHLPAAASHSYSEWLSGTLGARAPPVAR